MKARVRPGAAAHHARPRRRRRDGRSRRRDVRRPHRRGGAGPRLFATPRIRTRGLLASIPAARRRAPAGDRRHRAILGALPPAARSRRAVRSGSTVSAARAGPRCALWRRTGGPSQPARGEDADAARRGPPSHKHFTRRAAACSRRATTRRRRRAASRSTKGETFGLVGESGSGKTHDRPLHPAADRADVGRGAVPGRGRAGVLAGAAARGAARHADRLPGSVLVAEPADARRRRSSRSRSSSIGIGATARTRRDGRGAVRARRARSGPSRALSARVQRRSAPAHRRSRARWRSIRRSSSPTSPCRRSTSPSRRRS